jgi:hypothetical protein
MSPLPQEFARKIAKALSEEEEDVYVLALYALNHDDLNYFAPEDRERVKRIFQILADDTKRHAEFLRLVVELAG